MPNLGKANSDRRLGRTTRTSAVQFLAVTGGILGTVVWFTVWVLLGFKINVSFGG